MQHRIIYKKFALSGAFSLLMIISLTAIAGSNNYQYSSQLAGAQDNPWALPQVPEHPPGFQQPLKYQNQGRSSQNRTYQSDRFVTPQFLESLKRQQSQQQMMPENRRYPQFAPQQPESGLPGSGSFGSPPYGTDYLDPLYDTPAVTPPAVTPWSPWGIGSDTW